MAHDQHDEEYIRSHVHEYEGLGCDPEGGPLVRRPALTAKQLQILQTFSDPIGLRTGVPTMYGTFIDYGERAASTGRRSYR